MSSRAWRVELPRRGRTSQARYQHGVIMGRGILCERHQIADDRKGGRVCPLCYAAEWMDAKIKRVMAQARPWR